MKSQVSCISFFNILLLSEIMRSVWPPLSSNKQHLQLLFITHSYTQIIYLCFPLVYVPLIPLLLLWWRPTATSSNSISLSQGCQWDKLSGITPENLENCRRHLGGTGFTVAEAHSSQMETAALLHTGLHILCASMSSSSHSAAALRFNALLWHQGYTPEAPGHPAPLWTSKLGSKLSLLLKNLIT